MFPVIRTVLNRDHGTPWTGTVRGTSQTGCIVGFRVSEWQVMTSQECEVGGEFKPRGRIPQAAKIRAPYDSEDPIRLSP